MDSPPRCPAAAALICRPRDDGSYLSYIDRDGNGSVDETLITYPDGRSGRIVPDPKDPDKRIIEPLTGTWPGYGARTLTYETDANGNTTRTMRSAAGDVIVQIRLPSGEWYTVSQSDGRTTTEWTDTDGDGVADRGENHR